MEAQTKMPKMKRTEECLRLEGLRIQRGQSLILENVDWVVRKGEHWVILGANGSGKTSLLRALAGYFMPTAGKIFLLGKQYGRADWRQVRLRIGIVSSAVRQMMADTEPALISIISGRYAVIDYWGDPEAEDRRRAKRILRQVECGRLADRPWACLSQGERQRILIGRALMSRPALLVLDEPCAGLDPGARENFLQFLERMGRRKNAPTLILVTHHVEEITPVFTHVLMLRGGQVLHSGHRRRVMSSSRLSALFGAETKLRSQGGRYTLFVKARSTRIA